MKIEVTYKSGLTKLFLVPPSIAVVEFHELASIEGDLITRVKFI